MNIQNIQSAQGLLVRAAEGKTNAGKGTVSAESDFSRQAIHSSQAQKNSILPDQANLPASGGDSFELVYPPFFPVGNTQGIFTVMIEAKSDGSSALAQAENQADQKTAEAKTAEPQVYQQESAPIENQASQGHQTSVPGILLDLKV